jgi:chromate reductase, NAD(P)H dehydrogenase (quinone)
MYIIFSATNRPESNTLKVAKQLESIFIAKGIQPFFYSLENYTDIQKANQIVQLEQDALTQAKKIIIVAPEYNGSFPGIFKLMLDHCDIKNSWWHKKAMLVGVASGRQGNARGLDHLTNMLNYLKVNVMPNKVPLSSIHTLINSQNIISDQATINTLTSQIEEFIAF